MTLFGNRVIAGVIKDGVECIPNTVRLLTFKKEGYLDIHIGKRRMPCEV